ncbi:cation:proton antiporter [Halogeometricum limi]|uniref:Multicomponent Na+:H+ antiporter subunit F n=1 Tax=Halogeometricum limi TaxID=555875 RepID=A0A1I6GW98_9EURY|nr:cation:proton antiporter [Halogeometricum limi]SFR46317.1 multicomponent Na+:H+ antiporter subunit F [Halogeometricum limi]
MVLVEDALLLAASAFIVTSFVGLFRVVRGPTMPDRVIAINVVGSNVVIVIALLAAAVGEPGALDIALVYALLNFLLSVAISKFTVERGGVL